jgi:hypothetical protein
VKKGSFLPLVQLLVAASMVKLPEPLEQLHQVSKSIALELPDTQPVEPVRIVVAGQVGDRPEEHMVVRRRMHSSAARHTLSKDS